MNFETAAMGEACPPRTVLANFLLFVAAAVVNRTVFCGLLPGMFLRKHDIALAKGLLGREPKVPLAEGLAKTADYFRSKVAS